MDEPEKGLGRYHLITAEQGRYSSRLVAALGHTERPTLPQLENVLPALGLLRPDVEFALYWVSDQDMEAEFPVLHGSLSMLVKYSDYRVTKPTGETFVDYLNRVSSVLATGATEEPVTADLLMYALKRVDLSPEEAQRRVVMPPVDNPVEYEQLVARPGEVFMLVLYVEKHLSYHLVNRHSDVIRLMLELHNVQSEGQYSREWFDDWWARLEPIQMQLVAQNSDKGFSGLVKDLREATHGKLPDDFREAGISNLEELAELRNTIGHSTIYNSMVVDGKPVILPHVTKHTDRSSRQTIATHFDDETYELIKSMIDEAHKFVEICSRIPPDELDVVHLPDA